MIHLEKDEVLEIHRQQIEQYGGFHGIRDEAGLESALAAPANREYYDVADIVTCAATYLFHLTAAHAFIDGNKRIGAAVAEIFLDFNGYDLDASEEEIYELCMGVADGERISRDEVEAFFRAGARCRDED